MSAKVESCMFTFTPFNDKVSPYIWQLSCRKAENGYQQACTSEPSVLIKGFNIVIGNNDF